MPQSQLRRVDVTAHDLHSLNVDDIRNFDRDSLLQLSALLLSRQHATAGIAHSSSATESSANSSSSESARLQATVEILKVRLCPAFARNVALLCHVANAVVVGQAGC